MRQKQSAMFAPVAPDFVTLLGQLRVYGAFGDDLHAVILRHQEMRADQQRDGCVMLASRWTGQYGMVIPVIVALNNVMRFHVADLYPRIDRSDASGAEVSRVVAEFMT